MALAAVLVAILFLYLFMKAYKSETGGGPPMVMVSHQLSLVASTSFSGF